MIMGHSRKGAIDLLQKEAAVSGLFFNESMKNEREGQIQWKNGIFSLENGIFSAPKNLREECQPSYVPQLPFGDFASVSIPLAAMVTGCARGGEREVWDVP